MKLLLASKSPRRRELIAHLGWPVEFVDADVDEKISQPLSPEKVAEHLAQRKANAFPKEKIGEDEVVVAADTVVVLHGKVIGKPHSRAAAIEMLTALSGEKHTVYTGVCLRSQTDIASFTEATDVYFRQLNAQEVEHYVDTFRPFDKAGAYGIQEWIGMIGISRIDGCFYNVMGLPVSRLYEMLNKRFLSK